MLSSSDYSSYNDDFLMSESQGANLPTNSSSLINPEAFLNFPSDNLIPPDNILSNINNSNINQTSLSNPAVADDLDPELYSIFSAASNTNAFNLTEFHINPIPNLNNSTIGRLPASSSSNSLHQLANINANTTSNNVNTSNFSLDFTGFNANSLTFNFNSKAAVSPLPQYNSSVTNSTSSSFQIQSACASYLLDRFQLLDPKIQLELVNFKQFQTLFNQCNALQGSISAEQQLNINNVLQQLVNHMQQNNVKIKQENLIQLFNLPSPAVNPSHAQINENNDNVLDNSDDDNDSDDSDHSSVRAKSQKSSKAQRKKGEKLADSFINTPSSAHYASPYYSANKDTNKDSPNSQVTSLQLASNDNSADPTAERATKRLARKAELARASRKRKKMYVQDLEQKVKKLGTKIEELQRTASLNPPNNNSTGSSMNSPASSHAYLGNNGYINSDLNPLELTGEEKARKDNQIAIRSHLNDLISRDNLTPIEQQQLADLVKKFVSNSRERQGNIDFYLDRVEDCLQPGLQVKFAIW
jgi:hypothetical protein